MTHRLPVLEIVPTLQGEGAWAGTPAVFVRLAGCDVGCYWCDTRYSWEIPDSAYQPVELLAERVRGLAPSVVVITGGEPSMHDLSDLTQRLAPAKRIHIETAGVYPLRGRFDWVTLSPKKFRAPVPEVVRRADELKVIIANRHDLQWALQWEARVRPDVPCFVQPEWNRRHAVWPHIWEFLRQNPRWRLSVQLHKMLDIP